jgi:hypothetical protein
MALAMLVMDVILRIRTCIRYAFSVWSSWIGRASFTSATCIFFSLSTYWAFPDALLHCVIVNIPFWAVFARSVNEENLRFCTGIWSTASSFVQDTGVLWTSEAKATWRSDCVGWAIACNWHFPRCFSRNTVVSLAIHLFLVSCDLVSNTSTTEWGGHFKASSSYSK